MKLLCWLVVLCIPSVGLAATELDQADVVDAPSLQSSIQSPSNQYAISSEQIQRYIQQARTLQLVQRPTWQALMYSNAQGQSEVQYAKYFVSEQGAQDLQAELDANIEALFKVANENTSVRCQFPARSQWLIQTLAIPASELPEVRCPDLDDWYSKIKPHKATVIYATDFMGNPSSMFGHTLLRIDPANQKQLNLVSYAINYAATVQTAESWSYAWKGLTGQYPGEYSLMPYYRKVKEYGDFESRDLWEYELNLTEQETQFLVLHIWEMQHVTFPYYFVSDNCAYRILGLLDLVRPELKLSQNFKHTTIPIETIKILEQKGLVSQKIYRPALETQLLAQAKQHGAHLARTAHQVAWSEPNQMASALAPYTSSDQAKILEMGYDDLYLAFTSSKELSAFAQPRLRQLLILRSQIQLDKQREDVATPAHDPSEGHYAKNLVVAMGESQGKSFVEISHRQAYHDLIDPPWGYRLGTQLKFLDGAVRYQDDQLKLKQLELLTVNSYNPISPFKKPLSWGFNLGWQQEALDQHGQFRRDSDHGVARLTTQAGYSWANPAHNILCYGQMQTNVQFSSALDLGWRIGLGPTAGCQMVWNSHLNSVTQLELPYWSDSHQWNVRLNQQVQYLIRPQHSLNLSYEYQWQNQIDWNEVKLGYRYFFK